MATIGTILIQAANQAGGITGSGAPTVAGMGAGGGEGVKDLKHQKVVEGGIKDQNEANTQAPKFWTAAFKKMGIQMGLAGILKQSQIFTSTIGSLFQIFGAFVDVILAKYIRVSQQHGIFYLRVESGKIWVALLQTWLLKSGVLLKKALVLFWISSLTIL